MADTRKPNARPEDDMAKMRDRDEAEKPVTSHERDREMHPPKRSDQPEPSKMPGLDGDVFGR